MTVAPSGDLYFATAPRGKIYHYTRASQLEAVFEGRGTIASLAVDRKGNVYAGMSSTCRILRITPDGSQHEVMRGMSRRNRHVLAMKLIGDDLFATTGPAGGIYRIVDRPALIRKSPSSLPARTSAPGRMRTIPSAENPRW